MEPEKEKTPAPKNCDEAAKSREDNEGGASRPLNDDVSAPVLPPNSPAKNLQCQADSVPKTPHGDNGPPKNLQSLPTQDTTPLAAKKDTKSK